jgi:hypothetical protein
VALNDVRDQLLKSAEALVAFGLVDGERLKDIKKLPGYRPLAIDVATIAEVIRERWAVVQGKMPLSLADLDRYAAQALDLLAGRAARSGWAWSWPRKTRWTSTIAHSPTPDCGRSADCRPMPIASASSKAWRTLTSRAAARQRSTA